MRLFSAACLLAVLAAGPGVAQRVVFEETGWQNLVKRAKAEDKLIFVDVYTTWCGPCRAMDQNVFATAQAGQFMNENFLRFKADAENGEGVAIARQYGVRAYPTMLFVNGDGEEVYRLVGGRPLNLFLHDARYVLTEKNSPKSLKTMDKEYRQHRQDAAWLREYLDKRVRYQHLENANLAEEYLALLPTDSLTSPGTLRLLAKVNFQPNDKTFETLLAHRQQATSALDAAGEDGVATLRGAFARSLLGQFNRAVLNQSKGPVEKAMAANDRLVREAPELSTWSSENLEMMYFLRTQRFPKFLSLANQYLDAEGRRHSVETLAAPDSAGLAAFLKPYQTGALDSTRHPAAFRQAYAFWQHRLGNRYADDLELAARGCLELGTTPNDFAQGLGYITRAMEFGERSDRLATYAKLLHRMGRAALGQRFMNRAVARAYVENAPDETISQLEGDLIKMNLGVSGIPAAPGSPAPKRYPVGYNDVKP